MLFRFLQLRHALQAQFPEPIALDTHSVESLLRARNIDRPLSSIYLKLTLGDDVKITQLYQRWHEDIPALTREDWGERVPQYLPLMISARDRLVQLKCLHRVYYTP